MRLAIHKFSAPLVDELSIPMPRGTRVLSVQIQNGAPQVWAAVDQDVPLLPRRFSWRGTGHPLSGSEGRFIGTVQLGPLVVHLFENLAPELGALLFPEFEGDTQA